MQQDREVYLKVGSGSATDSATQVVRLRMATAVGHALFQMLLKSLRYEEEGCVENNDDGR